MNKLISKTGKRAGTAIAIGVFSLFIGASFAQAAEEARSIISVTGTGTGKAVPDMALISLGVQRQAKTAREALSQNNQAMAAVIAALKKSAIDDKDVQTSGFNIQPRYQYYQQSSTGDQRPPRIVGYIVSNQLTIRIRDLAKLGDVIDKTVSLGVNSGGNIRFLTQNPEEVLAKAREEAMANAILKATTLTKAAGVGLGKILTINENSGRQGPRPMRQLAMARPASADSVPIAAGENSYQVNVQVSWEIKQ